MVLVWRFWMCKYRVISLEGTFGKEAFLLDTISVRELAERLLKICYQRQLFPTDQGITQFDQTDVATSYAPTPYVIGSINNNATRGEQQ